MDLKLTIIRWQHSVAENPGVLILEIIGFLTVVFFIICFFLHGFLERRKEKQREKTKQKRLNRTRPES